MVPSKMFLLSRKERLKSWLYVIIMSVHMTSCLWRLYRWYICYTRSTVFKIETRFAMTGSISPFLVS
jgi:hypothetical protein